MKKFIFNIIATISFLAITLLILTGCDFNITINQSESPTNNTQNTGVSQSKVENIFYETKHEDNTMHYIIVTAKDKDQNTVWQYTTKKDYVAQYEIIEYLGENDNKIYLNEIGTITALDKQTGKVLWQNNQYKGQSSLTTFDNEGYVYLAGALNPKLYVIDPNGKTVNKILDLQDENINNPSDMKIENDSYLKITFPFYMDEREGENTLLVNIQDLKNTENKVIAKEIVPEINHQQIYGFEDVKSFKLDENGNVFVTFEPSSDLAKKYPNATTQIETNVKSIQPVFWGNGGYGTLVMTHKDGTISTLDSMNVYSKNIKVTKLNYININFVGQLITVDGCSFVVVDKNGESYINLV